LILKNNHQFIIERTREHSVRVREIVGYSGKGKRRPRLSFVGYAKLSLEREAIANVTGPHWMSPPEAIGS